MLNAVARIAWLAMVLGACSKPSHPEEEPIILPPESEKATTAAAPAPEAVASCALASSADVSRLLGIPGLGEPRVGQHGGLTLCHYGDSANPERVMIRFESGRSASQLDETKRQLEQSGQPITLVPELGDTALSLGSEVAGAMHSMIVVFKGSRTIHITAPAPSDKTEALARHVLSKL